MTGIPWGERVVTISIHPDMATRDDVAKLAAELMEANTEIERLQQELVDTRSAVKLMIGRNGDIPWPCVLEKEVDGFLNFIRRQREAAEKAKMQHTNKE